MEGGTWSASWLWDFGSDMVRPISACSIVVSGWVLRYHRFCVFCFMFVSKFRWQEFTSFSTSLRRKWFTVCRPCFFRMEQNAQWCVLGSWIEWEVNDWNCKLSQDRLQIKLLASTVSGRFSHHLLHQSPGWLQPFSLTGLEIGCRSLDMWPWVFSCCWVPSACSFWFPFQTCNSAFF